MGVDRDMEGFVNRLADHAAAHDPVCLWGVDYIPADMSVELPTDADGEVIRIGDIVERKTGGKAVKVTSLRLSDGWTVQHGRSTDEPSELVHHKARTLGDLKEDLADAIADEDVGKIEDIIREAYEIGVSEASR